MIASILISPSKDEVKQEINRMLALHLETVNVNINHPDLLYFGRNEKLGIAEARKIKKHFSLKPYSASGRAVVLEDASLLTAEAQNALLKTLEEPPANAILILGAGSDAKFLPTILSRCQIIYLNPAGSTHPTRGVDSKDIEKLFNFSIAQRFEYIEKLKDKEEFLHSLVRYFHQNLRSHSSSGNTQFLKRLLKAEQWSAQNVNIRAILEYLALAMPQKL